jgi:hypothetical protein
MSDRHLFIGVIGMDDRVHINLPGDRGMAMAQANECCDLMAEIAAGRGYRAALYANGVRMWEISIPERAATPIKRVAEVRSTSPLRRLLCWLMWHKLPKADAEVTWVVDPHTQQDIGIQCERCGGLVQ